MSPAPQSVPGDPDLAPDPDASVVFIQHHVPPIQAGEYRLTLTQEVEVDGGHEAFVTQAELAVVGERFAIDPSEIHSVYPPMNASGEYYNVLAHVVLKRRTLPWERSPMRGAQPTPASARDGVATWLALLVFDHADPVPKARSATVRDLVPTDSTGRMAASGIVTYRDAGQLDPGQAFDDPCQIVDVPLDLFRAIAPSLEDLRWLAHARQRSNSRKPGSLDTLPAPASDYAVIVANRLPVMGSEATVHLVSLEGMADYLPGGPDLPPGAHTIRLASLKSWSFESVHEVQSFSACLEALDAGPLALAAGNAPADGASEAEKMVYDALCGGYVALDHETRDGGRTVSWYRGPLSPYAVRRTLVTPIASADAAVVFDPAIGMFDVSHAVAWQIGRLLALQDRVFASQLFRWKLSARQDAVAAAERAILADKLGDRSGLTDLGRAAAQSLTAKIAAAVGTDVLPATPAAAAPAQPSAAAEEAETPASSAAPPARVIESLARLRLLKGVPFANLVADEALLPAESIRFFHLDFNWIDALVDGAFSLGRFTTGDLERDQSQAPDVHAAGAEMAAGLRSGAPADAPATEAVTGMLLHSKAVGWWPGTEIEAFGSDGMPLRLLRFETLAPDLLLALCEGVVAKVVLSHSPETVHFGLDEPLDQKQLVQSRLIKRLRRLDRRDPGRPPEVPVPMRDAERLVVQIATLAGSMKASLGAPLFTAAEFAMEMVEGVGRVTFVARGGHA